MDVEEEIAKTNKVVAELCVEVFKLQQHLVKTLDIIKEINSVVANLSKMHNKTGWEVIP